MTLHFRVIVIFPHPLNGQKSNIDRFPGIIEADRHELISCDELCPVCPQRPQDKRAETKTVLQVLIQV